MKKICYILLAAIFFSSCNNGLDEQKVNEFITTHFAEKVGGEEAINKPFGVLFRLVKHFRSQTSAKCVASVRGTSHVRFVFVLDRKIIAKAPAVAENHAVT